MSPSFQSRETMFFLPGCNCEVLLRFCRFYSQVPNIFTSHYRLCQVSRSWQLQQWFSSSTWEEICASWMESELFSHTYINKSQITENWGDKCNSHSLFQFMKVATLILASAVSQAQLAHPLQLRREKGENGRVSGRSGVDLGRALWRERQPRWVASSSWGTERPLHRGSRAGPAQPRGVCFGLHYLYMGLGEASLIF